ncbi:cysteine protein inhibitor B [Dorcoceras hygrometricum]|uniref:Cysteine protein inhibitor B n=1 Tax=Dorcoceras hygrometricum TaxID=472368 RepID=A0A2Z7A7L1_9LAMI|nr:cysteine protein inhibitor B [Dorcoceras hygrometricum]KZV38167.1 cysteine protein inhibitor B [Dorcoceras hygrometricum]
MHASAAVGAKVGGRRQVKNVENNRQIQDLGRFCVEQYNLKMMHKGINGSSGKLLLFSEVVSAETQVVSGIKYYLRIAAAPHGGGIAEEFEAVVLVKPWMHSKEVLTFDPSPRSY